MTKHKKENTKKIKDTIKTKKDKTNATIPFVYHKEETKIEAIQKKALPDLIPLVLRVPTNHTPLPLEKDYSHKVGDRITDGTGRSGDIVEVKDNGTRVVKIDYVNGRPIKPELINVDKDDIKYWTDIYANGEKKFIDGEVIEKEEQLFCEEVEEKGKEVEKIEKVKEVEKETIESILNLPMPSEFTLVSPTSNHTNEQKLERFIRLRKGPTPNKVNYYEFMGSGVSMATIGHIGEFYVGKFKLVRKYVSEDWTITIEDKIKK
jgi:hypothetical protein